MNNKTVRRVYYYKSYYLDFFKRLDEKVREKFNWTIRYIATHKRVPINPFKYLKDSGGIYEIRVEHGGNHYRVFSFFEKDQLIIIINGFVKKSAKTPKSEIRIARRIKKEYFDEQEK